MQSIDQSVEHTLEIRRSRFLGTVFPIESETDAKEKITEKRRLHPDAAHCCYAYILEGEQPIQRFSDDGEPSGTAGRPMIEVLQKNGLSHVLAVVVRYFGGIKLGAGGLVRAYGRAIGAALENTAFVDAQRRRRLTIHLPHGDAARVESWLQNRAVIVERTYDAGGARLRIDLLDEEGSFEARLLEATAGTASIRDEGSYVAFPRRVSREQSL